VRPLLAIIASCAAAAAVAACGSQGIDVPDDSEFRRGAELFAQRCSGCHTMESAGAQGSANKALRNQGPNLDERVVSYEDALYAIRNGGFSGAIMPQNIVVGDEAEAVADFVAEYAGSQAADEQQPEDEPSAEPAPQ
jgi:mono/diheme cytochrome c family protein